jgi:pyruvate dehydrogenase E1 component beta subunit/2-oxoisovalerate dehydrogenase E1 component
MSNEPAGLLTAAEAQRLLAQMVTIRRFEERCVELYGQGHIRGFLHLCDGQEAIAVGVSAALRADDSVVSTYREHGHALAKGVDAGRIMAELFGKREGVSGGRGGSMHLFDPSHFFFGGHAIVGGGLPVAVGLALADQMRGRERVTVCFFGEGAVAEGEFHEALNLASLWRLPVLFVCENNLYAMGSALHHDEAVTDIVAKAKSYAIAAQRVDGMDLLEVYEAAQRAVAMARAGAPVFLEMRTYRFRAHSMFDAQSYRDKAEVERFKDKDPIDAFVRAATQHAWLNTDDIAAIEVQARTRIDDAVAFAMAGELEPVETLMRHVVAEPRGDGEIVSHDDRKAMA